MFQRVVSRTPVRFSLAAGGNDLDAYWRAGFVGATVSLTIDKYAWVEIEPHHQWLIPKPSRLIDGVLGRFKPPKPLKIAIRTDLAAGTGLGTGGAITVGLISALSHFLGKNLDKMEIAEMAYQIERYDLGLSCGKKDQYSTAIGGLNLLKYHPNGKVEVRPFNSKDKLGRLLEHLLLFDSGKRRNSEKILKSQQQISPKKILPDLHILNQGALEIAEALNQGDFPQIGRLMDAHWQIKRKIIPGISNRVIDSAYERAIQAGALGGRISGAGAGGYLVIFCPPQKRQTVCQKVGLPTQEFNFEPEGTKIVEASPI